MADQQRFRPSFDTCDRVTPQCPVEATTYGAFFTLSACIIFTVFHAICLIYQMGVLAWGRTWSFSIFLAIGTAFELMGYAARISMTPIGTVWSYPAFVIQLLMLILGPTLVAAAISVTFKWIVVQEGVQWSLLKPKWYPWVFVGTDFLSIVIQAIGGAVSATATDYDSDPKIRQAGSALLIAGTAFQAANMAFCGGLMVVYWWRLRKDRKRQALSEKTLHEGGSEVEVDEERVQERRKFHTYLYAIIIAYCAILVRCIYRIPEMALGWGSTLMQDEKLFLILDGMMIAIAVLLLTVFHPAFYFPILRKRKPVPQQEPEVAAVEPSTGDVSHSSHVEGQHMATPRQL